MDKENKDISIKEIFEEITKNGNYDKRIERNRFFDFFEFIESLDDMEAVAAVEFIAKKSTFSLTNLKQARKSYQEDAKAKKLAAARQKNIEVYKKLFSLMDEIEMPGSFTVMDRYLMFRNLKTGEVQAVAKIFAINSRILAKDRSFFEIEKVELHKRSKFIAAGRDLIDAKKVAGIFADSGEIFDSAKAGLVTKFISEYLRINEDRIEAKIGRLETGWDETKKTFYIPSQEQGVTWLDHQHQLERRFKVRGEVKEQVEMLRELSKGRAMIPSLLALAAPLYGIIETLHMNYICHIGGLRGEGKSLGCKTAVSLFGVPDPAIYGKNWNATINGLETYCESMKCVPTWIDEMEAGKSTNEAIQFMYAFAEGTGRSRAFSKDGEVLEREIKTFAGVLFSTGEKGVDEVITKAGLEGRNKPLGLTRRVLDLNARNLWSGIDRAKVGRLMDRNYGGFALYWLGHLAKHHEKINEYFEGLGESEELKLDGKENLFYLLYTVLSNLHALKVIDDAALQRQTGFITELIQHEAEIMEKTKNIGGNFMEDFLNFVAQNINNFHNSLNEVIPKTVYGKIERDNLGVDRIMVLSSVVREFCLKNGYVLSQVVDDLRANNKIEVTTEKTGKVVPTKPVRVPGLPSTTRCYVFREVIVTEEQISE